MADFVRLKVRARRRWHVKRAAPLTEASGAWWLAGGIDPADCVAAYQGKGASSYAASLVNLHNPGAYDLVEGVTPDWESSRGWYFGAPSGSTDYLKTGIVPDGQGWSYLVQFSDYTAGDCWNDLFGMMDSAQSLVVSINANRYQSVLYTNGTAYKSIVPAQNDGNLAIAGSSAFRNGVREGSGLADWGGKTNTLELYLGTKNLDGSPYSKLYAWVQAFVVYRSILSDAQIAAVAAEMAAL